MSSSANDKKEKCAFDKLLIKLLRPNYGQKEAKCIPLGCQKTKRQA
jgi:hypothetical protein